MAEVIDAIGPCALPARRGRFKSMVRAIVSQQISVKAAQSVFARVTGAAGGFVTAERIGRLSMDELRACGLSGQKASYIDDLARRVRTGELRLDRVGRLDDEGVIEHLTQVRGIGRWTAEMFLMFVLNRPDVLPVDDLGIQNGFARVYDLRKRPDPRRMERLAAPWRPYRTVGCWYLWRSLDSLPG